MVRHFFKRGLLELFDPAAKRALKMLHYTLASFCFFCFHEMAIVLPGVHVAKGCLQKS